MDKLVDVLRRAVRGEVTLHPRVAARVLQNLRGEDGESPALFTELTERELDVLKLIANGLTNSQIAEKLVISEYTVKTYLKQVFCKLNVHSRSAMVYRCAPWAMVETVHREQAPNG